ncbi:MAG: ASCH domain-containing protein [Actinomycetota bacterium]|nr:ASCH domain-containing protein [Actinomycetota bacterium]
MIGDTRRENVEAFWRAYLDTLPPGSPTRSETYGADMFGDTIRLADEIGALILSGTKTATCSALWEYEAESEPLPEVGEKLIVLDGRGEPLCIVETIEVEVRPYDEVDANFAFLEGEGDRSLEHWREAHWDFFSRTLADIGKKAEMDMPLVCERFRVVYE